MIDFYSEYYFLFVYFFFCIILALMIYACSFILVQKWIDEEKISAYECGFAPFGDARNKIEIKFYLTAILFIVFDVEVVFLFPWILVLFKADILGFVVMLLFLFVLVVGFIYEWSTGAMDW